jgi:hypothetical protein
MTIPAHALPGAPRPSVAEIQQLLHTELTAGQRLTHVLLLLADLVVGLAVLSLWLTEPSLPLRTHLGFAAIVAAAAAWACYFTWTLARRRVLFARHRVVAARLAVTVSAVFLAGALALAALTPSQRQTGLAAAGMGLVFCGAAVIMLMRARRRLDALVARAAGLRVTP